MSQGKNKIDNVKVMAKENIMAKKFLKIKKHILSRVEALG